MIKLKLSKTMLYILLIIFAVITIFPFFWTLYVSLLKDPNVIELFPSSLNNYGLQNFKYLFSKMQIKEWYFNSIVVAVSTTFANLLFNTMAGYALARINFPGRNFIFMVIIGVMLIPFQITMIPVYILLAKMNLINTHIGLIIPFMFNSFGIFLMRQFFITVPIELEEAAAIDGLSRYSIFFRIMVPLAKNPLLIQFIIIFMWNWNSFIWPSILVNQKNMYTLPVGINTIKSQFFSMPTIVMAGVVVLIVPMIIIYIIFQRFIIRGIASSGIKN